MATQFDAVARISVDLRAFSRAAQQMTREGGTMEQVFRNLHNTLGRIEIVEKSVAAELSRSLRVYNQIAQAARNYATAVTALSRNSTQAATGSRAMVAAFEQLRRVLANVQGLSEREATRLQRTISLYNQMAQVLGTLARAQNQMAQATQGAQRLEQQVVRERQRAAEAAQRQALAEQRLALSRQQAATAARNAATAEANAQARLLRVQQQLAEARRRDEAAAQRQAAAQQRANQSFLDSTNAMFGLRSALGDLEGLYRNLSQGVLTIGTAAVSAAISHEAAFAQIERVTQLAGEPLDEMRRGFEELAVTLPVSFEELARVGQLASQTGVANDQLLAFTDTVVRFSVTTGLASDQVTLLLARIIQMRDLPIQDVDRLASTILDLGISSAATEDEILRITESIATVTDIFGLSTEATAGLASAFANLRVRPELARGSLTRVFAQLNLAVTDTGGAMATLQNLMGGTQESLQQLIAENPDEFFLRFVQGLSQTTDEGGQLRRVLADLGINAVRDIDTLSRLANNYDLLAEQVQRARVEFLLNNTLQEQSQTIFETTRVRIDNLRDAFQTFLAQAGKPFATALGQVATAATEVIQVLTQFPVVTATIGVVGAAVGVAALAWVGYRIAVAAAFRGVVAMSQAQTQLGATSFTLAGALRAFAQVQAQAAAATQAQAVAAAQAAAAQAAAARGITTFNTAAVASTGFISTAVGGMRNMATTTDQLRANFAASTASMSTYNAALASSAASSATMATATGNINRAMGLYAVTVPRVFNVQQGLANAYAASAAASTGATAATTANTVATTANATATTIAGRAATALAGALAFLRANWLAALGVVGALAAGVFAVAQAFQGSGNAMRKASEDAFQAVGGLQAYEDALIADTLAAQETAGGIEGIQKALRDSGTAASDAGRVYRTLAVDTESLSSATAEKVRQDLAAVQAQQRAIELAQGDIETLRDRAEGQGALAEAARSSLADMEALAAQEENYREALQGTTVALGENARALAQQQFQTSLIESGLVDTEQSYRRLSDAITQSGFSAEDLLGGEGSAQTLSNLREEIDRTEMGIDALGIASERLRRTTLEGLGFDVDTVNLGDLENQLETLQLLESVIEDNSQAFGEASRSAAILTQLGLDPLADAAQQDEEAVDAAAQAMEEYQARIDELAESYTQLIDPAQAWTGANEEATQSVEAFTNRLRQQVQAQQQFAQNLAVLSAQGYDALVEQLQAAGPEGAAAAAELVDATDAQLQELDLIARQAGADYTSALAQSMDRVSGLDLGGRAARNISQAIVSELDRVSSSGGDLQKATERIIGLLDLIDQEKIEPSVAVDILGALNDVGRLQQVIRQAEESGSLDAEGKAFLNTLLFDQTMGQLRSRVNELEERRDLDPSAEAHLSDEEYRRELNELRNSALTTVLEGLLDVKGDAALSDKDYQDALDFLDQLSTQTNQNGDLDVHGDAELRYEDLYENPLNELFRISNAANEKGRLDVHGDAALNTDGFINRQLPRIVQAAWSTGAEIEQALSRTATVSVVYANVNSPPPSAIYAASGGWIHGPGGPRDDRVPAMLSSGEFVVNARAAAKFQRLLEAINSGRGIHKALLGPGGVMRFADGGSVPRRLVRQTAPGSAFQQVRDDRRLDAGPVFNITNTYPREEPTSTTINRALAYAATISGV